MTEMLTTETGRQIACNRTEGRGPGIVFLGGFRSDMEGTKALYLEQWARKEGRAFMRFDYSGHGQSSGTFAEGCIGDWAEDAVGAISALTKGPQVLVGSSMGGWIALLLATRIPDRIAAMVGIAAAPDFTEDSMWEGLSDVHRAKLMREGQIAQPSDYGDPYFVTKRLIEDGRKHLVLRQPLPLPFPTRFLQGTADTDVDQSVALRLLEHATGPDIRLTLVKGADHRFSSADCLLLIEHSIEAVLQAVE